MTEKHVEGSSVMGSQLSMTNNGDLSKSKGLQNTDGIYLTRMEDSGNEADCYHLIIFHVTPRHPFCHLTFSWLPAVLPVKVSKDQVKGASDMVLRLMLMEGRATENSNEDEGMPLRYRSRSPSSNQPSLKHRRLILNSSPSQSSKRLNGHLNTLPASTTVNWHSFMEKVYEKFDVVISKVESLEQRLGRLEALAPSLPDGFTFPLEDVKELDHLDSLLFENRITRTRMVSYLAGVGGCGFIDCLRHILKTLMRATVSVKYNLTGVKGKLPFNQLVSLKSTIQDSIRQHYPLATVAEMDGVIAKWLTGSIDRDGNKKKRELEKLKRRFAK